MVDMNDMRQALVEALDSGRVGIECNCEGDRCTGTCTRAKVEQAIYEINQLAQFAFAIRHQTGMVSVVTILAPDLSVAIAQAFAQFGDDMNAEGFRCWPVKE